MFPFTLRQAQGERKHPEFMNGNFFVLKINWLLKLMPMLGEFVAPTLNYIESPMNINLSGFKNPKGLGLNIMLSDDICHLDNWFESIPVLYDQAGCDTMPYLGTL
jgi:hypothetical protein